MEAIKWTKVLFTVGFFVHLLHAHETHYLQYVYTITSELRGTPGPVYSAVGVYDGIQISHYSNEQHTWIRENVTADDWRNGPLVPPESREWLLNLYYTLANCTHLKCPEPHTLQRRVGCQVEKSSNGNVAYDEYRFDGVDFISLNFETMRWINKNPLAEEIRKKWNDDTSRIMYFREYLNNCLKWISTNRASMSQPKVDLFEMKAPCGQNKLNVTCLATGFYPEHIQMDILNGIKLKSLNLTGIRPNNDNTFQLRTTVNINREEAKGLECHVTHRSHSQATVVKFTEGHLMNSCEESRTHIIVVVVVAAFAVVALVMRKRRNGQRNSNERPNGDIQATQPNAPNSPENDQPITVLLDQTNGFSINTF